MRLETFLSFEMLPVLPQTSSRAGVLALSCDESLVFIMTGGNKRPLVFARLVPM